jgi:hypothetical protein
MRSAERAREQVLESVAGFRHCGGREKQSDESSQYGGETETHGLSIFQA